MVYVLKDMVSASKPLMEELRRLQRTMQVLGASIEARWLPSAVNRYADALSKTWDLEDMRATECLFSSIQEEYRLEYVVFAKRPLEETFVARSKYLTTQVEEF